MSNTNTGGPAFPLTHEAAHKGEKIVLVHRGMDLRDYFAAKAMQGLLSDTSVQAPQEVFARHAYAMADAMLEAREA